jgi:hypothetical protein
MRIKKRVDTNIILVREKVSKKEADRVTDEHHAGWLEESVHDAPQQNFLPAFLAF